MTYPSDDEWRERRKRSVDEAIARGDVAELLSLVEWGLCGCMGPKYGEPKCRCIMTADQVRAAVSYAALKLGRLVRLSHATTTKDTPTS